VRDQLKTMEEAGFCQVACQGITGFRTSPSTVGALFSGCKP